jgi:hypothetical protein
MDKIEGAGIYECLAEELVSGVSSPSYYQTYVLGVQVNKVLGHCAIVKAEDSRHSLKVRTMCSLDNGDEVEFVLLKFGHTLIKRGNVTKLMWYHKLLNKLFGSELYYESVWDKELESEDTVGGYVYKIN